MASKQELEHAKNVMAKFNDGGLVASMLLTGFIKSEIEAYINNWPLKDTSLSKRLIDGIENITWELDCHAGLITFDELKDKLTNKYKAQAEKRAIEFKRRLEKKLHPVKKLKKRPKTK